METSWTTVGGAKRQSRRGAIGRGSVGQVAVLTTKKLRIGWRSDRESFQGGESRRVSSSQIDFFLHLFLVVVVQLEGNDDDETESLLLHKTSWSPGRISVQFEEDAAGRGRCRVSFAGETVFRGTGMDWLRETGNELTGYW